MPVIKSAIKKLRKDTKRTKVNDAFRADLDRAVRAAKKKPTPASVSKATSMLDKAVKMNLMHKNKAARVKSSLSKLAKPAAKTKPTVKEDTTPVKKTAKKATPSKK